MILKVAVLDYKTIKPYLTMKNLLIVLGVTFFSPLSTRTL